MYISGAINTQFSQFISCSAEGTCCKRQVVHVIKSATHLYSQLWNSTQKQMFRPGPPGASFLRSCLKKNSIFSRNGVMVCVPWRRRMSHADETKTVFHHSEKYFWKKLAHWQVPPRSKLISTPPPASESRFLYLKVTVNWEEQRTHSLVCLALQPN